jgi:hypothetical protein
VKHLTIRHVTPDLERAIAAERRRHGGTQNDIVLSALRRAFGLDEQPYDNGLGTLAGKWSRDEFEEFERNTAVFDEIDQELWR